MNAIVEFDFDKTLKSFSPQTEKERWLISTLFAQYKQCNQLSKLLSDNITKQQLSRSQQSYLNFLSKEKHRAWNQFLSTFALLERIKTPPVKITVNTNSAYIADKQQNNLNEKNV